MPTKSWKNHSKKLHTLAEFPSFQKFSISAHLLPNSPNGRIHVPKCGLKSNCILNWGLPSSRISFWSSNLIFIFFNYKMNPYLYNNLSIAVRPSVCPNAISSHIYGQIWTLKVPMELLGQGGPNKTICKMIGPEMKKIYIEDTMCVRTSCVSVHYLLPHF